MVPPAQVSSAAGAKAGGSSWLRMVLIGRNPRATRRRLAVLLGLGLIGFVTGKFILLPVRVSGVSMLPTYREGSIHFVNRLAYWHHEPRRGDVVAIAFSPDADRTWVPPHILLVKRIIGLPGETVAFIRGRVWINGQKLEEPYEQLPCDWNRPPVKLAPDEYFVVGDNRSMPQRDHEFGVCQRRQIVGQVLP
ncbi:MAG TPA: signal peptidase I [Verrucomicrobiae bacterium]|nr:signal peptidase I [Verrucomicrobiae bacterium]